MIDNKRPSPFLMGMYLLALSCTLSSCLLFIRPPALAAIPNQTGVLGVELVINLGPFASDPSNSALIFSITDGPGILGSDSGIYRFTPTAPGTYSIEIAVSNGLLEVRRRFTIAVN
jgi:hypothetical protein